jgi:small subunit ribosomal protein S14
MLTGATPFSGVKPGTPIEASVSVALCGKYAKLKAIANDKSLDETERLIARLKMAEIPRNGNPTRIRNRCELTGRPRGYYRKFRLARVMLRDLANKGLIPGVTKSSW